MLRGGGESLLWKSDPVLGGAGESLLWKSDLYSEGRAKACSGRAIQVIKYMLRFVQFNFSLDKLIRLDLNEGRFRRTATEACECGEPVNVREASTDLGHSFVLDSYARWQTTLGLLFTAD